MTDAALDDPLKERIQRAYSAWLDARGFKPRRGQREMIAAIARTFTGAMPRVAAIEAGTGTGKTAAYALAAIPIAQALDKRLVIATATVALQEQIVLRDLPDIAVRSGLEFRFALAKGRGRYVCLKRLDDRLSATGQADLAGFEAVPGDAVALYGRLLGAFAQDGWDGDLDSWREAIDEDHWRAVTTDHRGCTNQRCGFFRQCPFFRARADLDKADVIVANLDLVLADLSLGGGAVLPEPDETFYVLDEAHHLADKTRSHFTLRLRARASVQWLEQANAALGTLAQRVGRPPELVRPVQQVADASDAAAEALAAVQASLAPLDFQPRDEKTASHRFALGRVPAELAASCRDAAAAMAPLAAHLEEVHALLVEVVDGERSWEKAYEAEDWLPIVGSHVSRAAAAHALLEDYGSAARAVAPDERTLARARWVSRLAFEVGHDLELHSAPLDTAAILQEVLFERAYGVLLTSATLAPLGRFERLAAATGLPEGALTLRIASPFRYPEIATLSVPAMRSDPRDAAAHTAEVAERIPDLLSQARSALVLFTSWRQLNDVVRTLPATLDGSVKVQGRQSKQALLEAHRADIDAGGRSYVFGVASFAEGVDLPDDYCRHVIIVKLPFAVPDDPVDEAQAEWVEAAGGNAFFEISLPDAAMRLVQACGRLIRHENDHGRITLLDRRVVTARYGRSLLAALPPFRREIQPG
jgi:ATP-dependent DNA helicase DinG